MGRFRQLFGILTFVVALGACSLMVDTAGLNGRGGTSDVSTLEPTPPSKRLTGGEDAGSDAGAAAALPASPCGRSDGHALCDDFEPDVRPIWDQQDVLGAFLTVSDAMSVSPPNALHAEKRVGAVPGRARLIGNVPQSSTRTTCELDVFVAQLSPANAELMLFAISFRSGNDYVEVDLRTSTTGSSLLEYGTVGGVKVDHSTDLSVAIPMGRWAHVRMDVQTTPTAVLDVMVDRKPAIVGLPVSATRGAASQIFVGGVLEFGAAMTWDVYADNVVCDVQR